jgi:hypothetical protein
VSRRDDKNAAGPPPAEPPGPPVPEPIAGGRPPVAEDAPPPVAKRSESGSVATGAGGPQAGTPAAKADSSTAEADPPAAKADSSTAEADPPAAKADSSTAEADPPAAKADSSTVEAESPDSAAAAGEPEPSARAAAAERTPALEVAATLRDLDRIEDEDEDDDERTVEALGPDAFGEASPAGFGVPTRQAEQEALEQLAKSGEPDGDEFSQEHTTVATLDGRRLDRAAARSEQAHKSSAGETYYRDLVREEISFSRATGYDREGTAVVPLAELARREEDRLRRDGLEAEAADGDTGPRRDIPVGEIIDVLRAARSVEEVAGVLVEIVSNLIPRVLLLWERRGRLFGFASRGMALTEVKLLTIELPRGLLQQMAAAELELDSFQGPPRIEGMVERLFDLLGARPPEVLLIPVQVTAEDRWLLYADNDDQPLPEFELRLLEVVASRAGARADWLLDRQSLW